MQLKQISGKITYADILKMDPFENTVNKLDMVGRILRKVLEESARILTKENEDDPNGEFLQVSGLQMTIQKYKDPNEVINLRIKTESGAYENLNDTKVYKVVTNSYLAKKLKEEYPEIIRYSSTILEEEVVENYIKQLCPTKLNKIGRINIFDCADKIEKNNGQEMKSEDLEKTRYDMESDEIEEIVNICTTSTTQDPIGCGATDNKIHFVMATIIAIAFLAMGF